MKITLLILLAYAVTLGMDTTRFEVFCFPLAHGGSVQPIQEIFEPAAPLDPLKWGKVAVVQWNQDQSTPLGVSQAQAEQYKQRNRETLAQFIRQAAQRDAKLVITPEFAIVNYPDIQELPSEEDDFRNREDIGPYVEPIPGPSTEYFGNLSRELGIYIHISFAEVDLKTNQYFNVIAVLDPEGRVVAKYHKINLFELENQFLSPGTDAVIYVNRFFGAIGLALCADIYSSHPMSSYQGPEVNAVALSTSWASMNTGMTAFRRAARLAKTYVLASNNMYFPDSGIINPDGTNQSWIRQSEGIAYGYLPLLEGWLIHK